MPSVTYNLKITPYPTTKLEKESAKEADDLCEKWGFGKNR